MGADKVRVFKRKWTLLYQAAVNESDDQRRLHLIGQAKKAILERQRALAITNVADLQERQALQDAAYVLAAMRRAAEFNLRRRVLQREHRKTGTG